MPQRVGYARRMGAVKAKLSSALIAAVVLLSLAACTPPESEVQFTEPTPATVNPTASASPPATAPAQPSASSSAVPNAESTERPDPIDSGSREGATGTVSATVDGRMTLYTVAEGDTVSDISDRFGLQPGVVSFPDAGQVRDAPIYAGDVLQLHR
ncbi:MAG TPA: LysM domain-containing protein [Glaciihabitans sp.]|jgi:biotin carboxyl carrier protein|nr:LysM domain-containing protein [Glaciihabitans sp.]